MPMMRSTVLGYTRGNAISHLFRMFPMKLVGHMCEPLQFGQGLTHDVKLCHCIVDGDHNIGN